MGRTAAAIVAGDIKAVVAERPHHFDLVLGHGAERVVRAVRLLRRRRTVAVAAQIGRHDMKPLGQARRHLVPRNMGQRVAVQKQQRRPAAAVAQADARAARLDVGQREAGHDFHGVPWVFRGRWRRRRAGFTGSAGSPARRRGGCVFSTSSCCAGPTAQSRITSSMPSASYSSRKRMHSAGVPTQNDVPCSRTSCGRRLARMRPGGEALVALVIALIVGRHGGRVVVAPHQAGALALLLDVPADQFGAALGDDLRVLVAIARRHQRGARGRAGAVAPGRSAARPGRAPSVARRGPGRLRCRTGRPSPGCRSGAPSRRCRRPTTAAGAAAAPASAGPRGAGSGSTSRRRRSPPGSRCAAAHRRIPATCRACRADRCRTG